MAHSFHLPSIIKLESLGSDRQRTRPSTQFGGRHKVHSLDGEAPCLQPEHGGFNARYQKRAESIPRLYVPRDPRPWDTRAPTGDEEITADETAADGAGGGAHGHFDVGDLLNGGSNGVDVLRVVSLERLAFGECRALNEVHDDIPTPPAREAKVNRGDADDVRRVDVYDPCHISLRTAFTFDPVSRLACDPDADAIPVGTAQIDDLVAGRKVCWDVR